MEISNASNTSVEQSNNPAPLTVEYLKDVARALNVGLTSTDPTDPECFTLRDALYNADVQIMRAIRALEEKRD